jgi:hypothetical protein
MTDSVAVAAADDLAITVEGLIEGRIALSSIPVSDHLDLLTRLQVLKKENLVGRTFERARRCQTLIDQLRISKVQFDSPPRIGSRPQTGFARTWQPSRLPSITSSSSVANPVRVESEIAASERF